MSQTGILSREELQIKLNRGYTADVWVHDAALRARIAELEAKEAAMSEALADHAPHGHACSYEFQLVPCDCYLSTLTDAVSRGRELLEAEELLDWLEKSTPSGMKQHNDDYGPIYSVDSVKGRYWYSTNKVLGPGETLRDVLRALKGKA